MAVDSLTELIVLYTERLEELDQFTIAYIMTCMGLVGVVFGTIATLLSNENVKERSRIYKIVSILFMLIPIIVCIFLAVATINLKKVAMYRGYLRYLESL